MFLIEEYIKLSKNERQTHLQLNESCIERGGDSRDARGILAQHLNTTIPVGLKGKVCLCHACFNSKCSNPKHLYWGTYSENLHDTYNSGYKQRGNPYQRVVEKYGLEEAHNILKRNLRSTNPIGRGN